MKTIIGFYLIDAEHSALNNAGEAPGDRTENKVHVKQISKRSGIFPYVSGQAVRYWWRTSLRDIKDWDLSPMEREKKISYSEADPIKYPDDDIFGYMKAPGGRGNETLTRASPLKVSPLLSVKPHRPNVDYGTSTRAKGDPVPYEYEFYSTIMKGAFSLDLDSVGVYRNEMRSGFMNLSEDKKNQVKEDDAVEVGTNEENSFVCFLSKKKRNNRIKETIGILPMIYGGAKQASLLTDVSPKFLVLAKIKGGNNIFLDIDDSRKGEPIINVEAFIDTVKEYKDLIESDIYVGTKPGFLAEIVGTVKEEVIEFNKNNKIKARINYGNVRESVNNFLNELYSDETSS